MNRRHLAYLLWRHGRAPADYVPTYADLSFWLADGFPGADDVRVSRAGVPRRQ